MSAQTFELDSTLYTRSMFARAGVKKTAKQLLSRSSRLSGKAALRRETLALANSSCIEKNIPFFEANDFAPQMTAFSTDMLDTHEADLEPMRLTDVAYDDDRDLPLDLAGSLPDYMLEELEQSRGDVFSHLAMFESVTHDRNARKAFACRMDEAEDLYA